MNQQDRTLLFQPGAGHPPPYLAGRETEKQRFEELLQQLQAGHGIPADIILIGPRGNGKTVLLRWLEEEAKKRGLDVVWLTPDDIPDPGRLANALRPPSFLQWLWSKLRWISLFGFKAGLNSNPLPGASLDKTLLKRCRKTPLILLLDEAHALAPEVGRILLNTSQKVRSKASLLLVLAGTPNLLDNLNSMDTTFWTRAEQMGIGRISPDATEQALTIPINQAGVQFDPAALDTVVADTQCYPFFIQRWGEALWRQAEQTEALVLEKTHVTAVRPEVEDKQNTYYEGRRGELKDSDLLPVAVAVAAAYAGGPTLREHALDKAIAGATPGATPQQVRKTRRSLQNLGYIWKPPGTEDNWEPGIPNLMTYVRAHPV